MTTQALPGPLSPEAEKSLVNRWHGLQAAVASKIADEVESSGGGARRRYVVILKMARLSPTAHEMFANWPGLVDDVNANVGNEKRVAAEDVRFEFDPDQDEEIRVSVDRHVGDSNRIWINVLFEAGAMPAATGAGSPTAEVEDRGYRRSIGLRPGEEVELSRDTLQHRAAPRESLGTVTAPEEAGQPPVIVATTVAQLEEAGNSRALMGGGLRLRVSTSDRPSIARSVRFPSAGAEAWAVREHEVRKHDDKDWFVKTYWCPTEDDRKHLMDHFREQIRFVRDNKVIGDGALVGDVRAGATAGVDPGTTCTVDTREGWLTPDLSESWQLSGWRYGFTVESEEGTPDALRGADLSSLTKIALALDELHRNGGAHCDVKPDNVVGFSGGYRLVDWELMGVNDQLEASGRWFGTRGFIPDSEDPETPDLTARDRFGFLSLCYEAHRCRTGNPQEDLPPRLYDCVWGAYREGMRDETVLRLCEFVPQLDKDACMPRPRALGFKAADIGWCSGVLEEMRRPQNREVSKPSDRLSRYLVRWKTELRAVPDNEERKRRMESLILAHVKLWRQALWLAVAVAVVLGVLVLWSVL